MKPVLVLYATREGHTRRIAERLVEGLSKRDIMANMQNAADLGDEFSLANYRAAIVAASVHRSKHEAEIVDFVKLHLDQLQHMPTAFLSVSLSEAGVEDESAPPERRAQASADVAGMIDAFLVETGWLPARIKAVAGALLYSKYNFLMRFIMKRIAKKAGGDTDTSKDYEYTDWKDLEGFVDELAQALQQPLAAKQGA